LLNKDIGAEESRELSGDIDNPDPGEPDPCRGR
jgi:hypothetical protein